ILARVALREGARYIPVDAAFCSTSCALEMAGRPLYSDSDHISLHAARDLVGPWLKAARIGDATISPTR
ncbi:MAG: SGNH hydrolase domain-containing protein, partial [Sphingomonas sp.]